MSSSSKDASSWRKKKDQIHFVNARPSSETEKLRIQRMVRAHVGKWISDQTRDRDPAENPNQIIADQHTHNHHNAGHSGLPEVQGLSNRDMSADSLQRVIVKEESESELERKPFLGNWPSSSSSTSSSPEVGLSGQSSPEAKHAGVGSHRSLVHTVRSSHGPRNKTARMKDDNSSHNGDFGNNNGHAAATHGLPTMDRIASNTWNPFHAYPSHYSPEFLRLHEGYSLSTIWPFLTPSSPSGSGIAANSTWFPLSLTDSTLFTAFLFSSMSHKCIRWRNRSIPDGAFKPPDFRALQMIEIEAINLINKAIQDPSRAASDAVILSVLCMAHNPTYCSPQNVSPSTPFAAPLQRLQWLEVFGNSAPNIVHVRGLMQMIMLRGGVEKIELPGLASILSLSDIFTASAYLTQPAFAWMPLENSRRGLTLPTLLGFTHLDIERKFGKFKPIGITPEMAETFQAAWVYTRIVDTYIKGAIPKADLSLLTDQRNLVHHTIISLPSATPTTPSSPSTYHHPHKIIYEATRLAALIYSIGVIFPLPAGSSPLSKLASLVQSILQLPSSPSSPTSFCSASNTCIWTSSPAAGTLLFWILLLGGIAAENRPERPWFVTALGHTARRASIVSWDELRGRLEEVLWFDLACEQPGRRLWGEVESSLLSV